MFEDMGIKVIGVVSEPACAFLYHALVTLEMEWEKYYAALREHKAEEAVKPSGLRQAKILVFDIGGGTTDISMHHITKFEAVCILLKFWLLNSYYTAKLCLLPPTRHSWELKIAV